LRVHIGGGQDAVDRVNLIIDLYKTHWTEQVPGTAEELNIEMISIPASCTDEFQPLDRKVFGPLKVKAKHEYQMEATRGNKRGKMQACQAMMKAWDVPISRSLKQVEKKPKYFEQGEIQKRAPFVCLAHLTQ
jgi:hypothetical protein